ncbi:sensor histidine kinase [Streptomyces sp. NPDC050738]|uniref:sensor histidine kinase n=1 Tax=Streptomyces sp. NPDC050738 TaxID=3154744 RepID=UPI003434E5E6
MTPPSPPPPPTDGLLTAGLRNLRALAHGIAHPSHAPTAPFADSPRQWQRILPYVVVLSLTGAFLPITIVVLTGSYDVPGALAGALAVAQTVPLLMLAHRPLQAWWIVLPADVAGALVLVGHHYQDNVWPWPAPVLIGYLFLLLAIALREKRRTLIGVWLITGAACLGLGLAFPDRNDGTNALLFILSSVVLVIGGAVRERGEAQRRLSEAQTLSEAERAQRTLLEERARIARELHDVVAHHMSVITVQADSAPYRLTGLSAEAAEEFGSIAASARESLSEMRRLLVVLRNDGTEGERAPQPGIGRAQQLVEATVRAGVPAELSLPAALSAPGALPPAVDLSAYRIVQEALANVVRHAPGAPTRVSVASDGAYLTVVVVNGPSDAPGSPLESGTGTGHGLIGMRERVRLTGGALDTGPLPDGGFRVAARMPLAPSSDPSPEDTK